MGVPHMAALLPVAGPSLQPPGAGALHRPAAARRRRGRHAGRGHLGLVLKRTRNIRRARTLQLAACLVAAAAFVIPAPLVASATLSVVLLSLSFFSLELNNAVLWAIPMDVAPEFAGTAG